MGARQPSEGKEGLCCSAKNGNSLPLFQMRLSPQQTSAILLALISLTAAGRLSATEYSRYKVDFSSPPHTVGFPPASGNVTTPSDRVTSVVFGHPTVVSSFSALTDQPLELRGDGMSPNYSQILFGVDEKDFVVFETDLCFRPQAARSGLTFLFDTPQVRTVTFTGSGFIQTFVPGLSDKTIGQFSFDQKIRFRAELNLVTHRWRLFLNGVLLDDEDFDAQELDSIRIDLTDAAVQNPAAGIDNVIVTGYEGAASFIEQPMNQTRAPGQTATFTVLATGGRFGLTYQWYRDGKAIPGANGATLTIDSVKATDAGAYSVVASNNYGPSASAVANLVVDDAPAHLQNISTRLDVQTGDNVLIGGFIIQGAGSKKVILRAIGPSLGVDDAPLPGRLTDPQLELYNSAGTLIATNDNWRDTQEQEVIASTVPPANDYESAIVANLQPGSYTAIVRGRSDGTGIALVEVYDLDGTGASNIANVSTRGYVQSGDKVMIGGFILGGAKPATLLIRAIGPSLQNSGVSSALLDPMLEIYNAHGDLIGQNQNWKDTQQSAIDGTGTPPSDDREAAIVTTLGAGNYTAIVRGTSDTAGVALVEVYRLTQ